MTKPWSKLMDALSPERRLRIQERRRQMIAEAQERAKLDPGKLKPCPHCGSRRVEYYNGWGFGVRELDTLSPEGREPEIVCQRCGCGFSARFFGRGISDEYAMKITVKAWNRRPKKVGKRT